MLGRSVVTLLSCLAALAGLATGCSAPEAVEARGGTTSAIGGNPIVAKACATRGAYLSTAGEQVSVDDLPEPVAARLTKSTVLVTRAEGDLGVFYAVRDEAQSIQIYDEEGRRLARAERDGAELVWFALGREPIECADGDVAAADEGSEDDVIVLGDLNIGG